MKKSEELRIEAGSIESDIAYLGVANKIMREERKERFEEKYLHQILAKDVCVTHYELPRDQYEMSYIRDGKQETIDYFPKANKILIRSKNKWIKPGLQWLIKNFELK
jgi:hypothetical protein